MLLTFLRLCTTCMLILKEKCTSINGVQRKFSCQGKPFFSPSWTSFQISPSGLSPENIDRKMGPLQGIEPMGQQVPSQQNYTLYLSLLLFHFSQQKF